jgi:hypothetical protein
MARGWSLLLAGSFGLVCLFGETRPFFVRAMATLGIALAFTAVLFLMGPVTLSQASQAVAAEYAQRTSEFMSANAEAMARPEWAQLVAKVPALADAPAQTQMVLTMTANLGVVIFPSMLALESLAALALVWATYHRLSRTRLGAPLRPLRMFRFNDQWVWGLIVGLTILLLPTLQSMHGVAQNLLVFFGALYVMRGFGVLTWFMAPRSLAVTVVTVIVLVIFPILGFIAASSALALGLGDTWADWRNRARPTS